METDKKLYKIFSSEPNFLFDLIGNSCQTNYSFKSLEIKELARTMDGLLEPEDPNQPFFVVEFQNNLDNTIYERIIHEMASLSKDNPNNIYHGIIIFGDATHDPKREPWVSVFTQYEGGKFQIFYLDDLLKKLSENKPDHPLNAVFYPLRENDSNKLEKNAEIYFNKIKNSQLSNLSKDQYLKIFVDWLIARFTNKNRKEILKMLPTLDEQKNTQFYKDVYEEGENKGKIEGKIEGEIEGEIKGKNKGKIEGKIEVLKEFNSRGLIAEEEYQSKISELEKKLNDLEESSDAT